jgi:hypothetical protein
VTCPNVIIQGDRAVQNEAPLPRRRAARRSGARSARSAGGFSLLAILCYGTPLGITLSSCDTNHRSRSFVVACCASISATFARA